MIAPLDRLSNLALEVYALASTARSCSDYETCIRIASELKKAGEALAKLAPDVFEETTDRILRRLTEKKFPELNADTDVEGK